MRGGPVPLVALLLALTGLGGLPRGHGTRRHRQRLHQAGLAARGWRHPAAPPWDRGQRDGNAGNAERDRSDAT